jgi:hypothetical protein
MTAPDFTQFPLSEYFLSGYTSVTEDVSNFPLAGLTQVLRRYEDIFMSALDVLNMTKERLKSRSEFNFDSGNAANLEGGIAILRVAVLLHRRAFGNITLVVPRKGVIGADLLCEKDGERVCCEVKAITKQSTGRSGFFLREQLFEKIRESIAKAREQLKMSALELHCSAKIFACVVNWFDQSIYLTQEDYQLIVNRLERDGDQEFLGGIDAVWFVTKMGQDFPFQNEGSRLFDR